MKKINGQRYMLCLSYWHEEWNHESMSRWQPMHMFASMLTMDCLVCQQMRRQLHPRRLERLRRMEEQAKEEEEQESSSSSSFEEKTQALRQSGAQGVVGGGVRQVAARAPLQQEQAGA